MGGGVNHGIQAVDPATEGFSGNGIHGEADGRSVQDGTDIQFRDADRDENAVHIINADSGIFPCHIIAFDSGNRGDRAVKGCDDEALIIRSFGVVQGDLCSIDIFFTRQVSVGKIFFQRFVVFDLGDLDIPFRDRIIGG